MELFHSLYLACLGGMGVCAAASVFLFVRLDIRTVWRVLAGAPGAGEKKKTSRRRESGAGAGRGTVVLDPGGRCSVGNRERCRIMQSRHKV